MLYHGRLSEIDFLNRIYDLSNLPSTDGRFKDSEGDIWQHTVNNYDWDNDWVFSDKRFKLRFGDDEVLLSFLCEMFHPEVRNEDNPWREFLSKFNDLLSYDGYELYEKNHSSGRAIYGWKEIISNEITIKEGNPIASYELKMIGEGSYANVYKYKDKFYGKEFVLKRAKKELLEKEIARFKREFEEMKNLRSPYIVEVYNYCDENEYVMEYMNYTLYEYINKNNDKFTFTQKKRIAYQALQGFKYIHSKELLHRDISPMNVLIKKYDDVDIVKVSDFGLVKIPNSTYTSLNTEFKGWFNDPGLRIEGFNSYSMVHETYALTILLFFIMTGRENTSKTIKNRSLEQFLKKGINPIKSERYQNIDELIIAFNNVKE